MKSMLFNTKFAYKLTFITKAFLRDARTLRRDAFLHPCVPCVNLLLLLIVLQCHQSFTGARTVQRDAFSRPYVPCANLLQFFFPLLFLKGRRDFIAGHFYESRLTRLSNGTVFSRHLRQFANCFAMSATFP